MGNDKSRSSLIEIMIMLAVFILVIQILTQAFVLAQKRSARAERLTNAVIAATNAAEALRAVEDEKELCSVLDGDLIGEGVIAVHYNEDLQPDVQGKMQVVIHRREEDDMVYGTVTVFWDDEQLYELETGYCSAGRE